MTSNRDISIIPFSHLDLFWAGTREECLSRGCHIIRQALSLLDAHDDFRFMIESTNFLEHHLSCFPEDRERLRHYVQTGRLELVPLRSIIYSHLPCGETTIRNILYGLDECERLLGVRPDILSMSDIPGATPQLPQLAAQFGMRVLVLSRGCPVHTDFARWHGLDGTVVDAYYPLHYARLSGMLTPFPDAAQREAGRKRFAEYCDAVDYPQIMHWGMDLYAPTEEIYQFIKSWNAEGRRPLRYATFKEFFAKTTPVAVKELYGEIPSEWPNIESSWPDLWPQDIEAEAMLHDAEWLSAINVLMGRADRLDLGLRQAWDWLLDGMDHNQNGIGGEVADEDKLRLKTSARDVARQCFEALSRRFAARTTAPRPKAFPIVIFNSLSWRRSELVRARTAMYGDSFAAFRATNTPHRVVRLIDDEGREVPYRLVRHLNMVADTYEVEFFARDIPALGARAYYLEAVERAPLPAPAGLIRDDRDLDRRHGNRAVGHDEFENDFFKLSVDRITGDVAIHDKIHDRSLLSQAALQGVEERRGNYISSMPLSGRVMPTIVDGVEWPVHDAISTVLEISGRIYNQRFTQRWTLWAERPLIELENRLEWREHRYVRIEQSFSLSSAEDVQWRYGVPFGRVRYPESIYYRTNPAETAAPSPTSQFKAMDVTDVSNIRLAREWVDGGDSLSGLSIGADHRMWVFNGNTASCCMLRGIGCTSGGVQINEDGSKTSVQRPPFGDYVFRFRLEPRDANASVLGRCGHELNAPLRCVGVGLSQPAPAGEAAGLSLPVLPDCSDTTVVVSWVKLAEEKPDTVVLRCHESAGVAASLHLPAPAGYAWRLADIEERPLAAPPGEALSFKPYEIKTLLLVPQA
ncbi:MAG: glycosyl hydrolase-related protein [Lentisphaeria bacterium]|jgi:hypothetical protein